MKTHKDNTTVSGARGWLAGCKFLCRLIPTVPWWLISRLLRMEKHDRDYDWSLRGMLFVPSRPGALVSGWLFWLVAIALIAILARRVLK